MKNIALSVATVATMSIAGGDIAPVESTTEVKKIAPVIEYEVENSFMDRFHFKGDLRLRYESIERDDKENKYRNRYRMRLGAKVDLIKNLQFQAGMRSGFANPTSGNQTFHDDEPLGDYFSQSFRFNIVSLNYKSGNSIYKLGRQPYMMYRPIKSQLVWDNDVSMNGANYQYKDDTKIITVGINQPTLEEKATDEAEDVSLFIAQYVHKSHLDFAKLNLGLVSIFMMVSKATYHFLVVVKVIP